MGVIYGEASAMCLTGAVPQPTPVITDSSLSGNGVDNPLGVVQTAFTSNLWFNTATATGFFTGALSSSITGFDFVDLYGSGTAAGQAYTRIPVISPWNSAYMRSCVYSVGPWASNYALAVGQRIVFPTETSFSAGSSFYFGMGDGATSWAAGNRTTSNMDIRLYRVDGIKYNTGE